MTKTVFFDLGNVLLFFSHQKMCKQIAQFCQLDEEIVKNIYFNEKIGEQYERGLVDSHFIHTYFCNLAKKPLNFGALMTAVSDIFEPNVGITTIIKTLKNNGVRLVLLSNTCQAHFDYAYTHFSILHHFDAFTLSYEVGAVKPEAKIFEKALLLGKCSKKNCFYTDDIKDYVDAARRMGIPSEVYTTPEKLTEQLVERGFLC